MTTDTDVTYETRTVRAIRGTESRTIKKWEGDGWELVSQTPGRVQTEIILRRPKPKSRRLLWILGGSAFVLVLATVITVGVIREGSAAPVETTDPVPSRSAAAPSVETSPEPANAAPTSAPEQDDVVLTPESSPELAALLAVTDYCAPDAAAFAAAHGGETIAFPEYVGGIGPHDGATTRYDILLGAGDFSETSAPGPSFQFRDVNTTSDLGWVVAAPDAIGAGTNLNITAVIDRYEENSCLFLLDPVTTSVR
jgi:hypothetical protein